MTALQKDLANFYEIVIAGDRSGIAALFPGTIATDTPRSVAIDGTEALVKYLDTEGKWLRSGQPEVRAIDSTENESHMAIETILKLTHIEYL